MSQFPLQITHHTKNQKDLKLNEKRESIDARSEMTELLESCEKVFIEAIIKLFQSAITNLLETMKT